MSPPAAISAQQLAAWRADGVLVVADALAEAHRTALARWAEMLARPPGPGEQRLHYFERTAAGRTLCRAERFLDDDPALGALLTNGALPAIAGALLGEPAVLYKEKLNYKASGGAGFAAHQDAVAYPGTSRTVTCLLAADAETIDNGCLEFALGRHTSVLPTDAAGCVAPAAAAAFEWRPLPLAAGSALFFSDLIPHRSGPNRTAASRRAFYLTYSPASEGDLRARYYALRAAGMAAEAASGGGARISLIGHFQGEPA